MTTGQPDDWEFVQRFVREVRREDESGDDGEGDHPDSNWLASFRDIRELTNIIRSTLGIKGPLPRVALLEALRHECEYNLRQTMSNHRGRPSYSHLWLDRVRRRVNLTPDQLADLNKTVTLTFEQMQDVIIHITTGFFHPDDLLATVLTQVVSSGALLDYDRDRGGYFASPLLTSLHRLRDEIGLYRRRLAMVRDEQEQFSRAWAASRPIKGPASIRAMSLFYAYSVHDNQHNIVRLLLGILRYLHGHTTDIQTQLRPASPIEQFTQDLEGERVTEQQLENWLRDDELLLRVGATDTTDEQRRNKKRRKRRFNSYWVKKNSRCGRKGLSTSCSAIALKSDHRESGKRQRPLRLAQPP